MSAQATWYRRLADSRGRGDPFDRHVFACLVAAGLAQDRQSLWDFLGLMPGVLADLLTDYFPDGGVVLHGQSVPRRGIAIEEDDVRQLLLTYRTRGVVEEEWLAQIVARRSQEPNHLWEDLGLASRDDLNRLLKRHFPGFFVLNGRNMRWKKFIYRTLCEAEGLLLCKSPHCEQCCDFALCFEPAALQESAVPLEVFLS